MTTSDVVTRRRMLALIVFCVTLLASPVSHAASAITPAIWISGSTIVCAATNTNSTPPQTAVTLNIFNGGGALKATASYNLDNAEAAVLDYAAAVSGDSYFCEVVASTNALVDNLRVGLYRLNGAGEAVSAVKGRRVGTTALSLVTPVLEKASGQLFQCLAVTTAAQSQLTFTLFDESGSQVVTSTISNVAAGTVTGIQGQNTDATVEYCEVRATTSTNGNKLRATITVLDSGADSIASADAE